MRVQLRLVEWRPFFIEKLVYESWNVQIARLLCAWLTGRRATFIHACRLYVFVPMNQTCLARAELVLPPPPPPAWAAFIQLIYYSTCISPSVMHTNINIAMIDRSISRRLDQFLHSLSDRFDFNKISSFHYEISHINSAGCILKAFLTLKRHSGKFSKISNGQRGISFWRARQLSVQPFDFSSAFAPVSSSVLSVYNTDVMEYAWERRLAIVQPDTWYLEADSMRKNHQKSGRLT
ncbi:hypothetical protein T08_8864 [Trichinella sp. T8]|nr:hypothetical protein T08_8864 [Trichinella sp. T8]